jgi:Fic family protein
MTILNEDILNELRKALLSIVSLESFPDPVLERQAIFNTWGTNSIEGNTLTLEEVRKVLIFGVGINDRPIRDILETVNHYEVFRNLHTMAQKRIKLDIVLELHEKVFKGVKPDAGQWRRSNVWIQGANFIPPQWEKVIRQMTEWLEEYAARGKKRGNVFESAAWMHHRFESIHPFTDGNGRVGRLLLNLHFLRHDWPPVDVTPLNQMEYYNALDSGNGGDMSTLSDFLRIAMGQSLLELLDQVGMAEEDGLSTITELGKNGPYSAKYLGLRAKQGNLPAVKRNGEWMTSRRVLDLYQKYVGRN